MKSISVGVLLMGLLVFCSVVIADYPMFHYTAERTGNVNESGPLTNLTKWISHIGGLIESSPVISNGRIFISNWWVNWSYNGSLYCINESSGTIIWKNSIGGAGGASTPAVYDDMVFVGALDGNLYCINASTGDTIWSKKIENNPGWYGVASSPLIYKNNIFITSFSDGTLYAFDFDGNEMWNFSTGNSVHPYVSPSAFDNVVFFVGNYSENCVFAINISTGGEVWNFSVDDKITTTPAIEDNRLIMATERELYVLNASNGNKLWSVQFPSKMSSPAVDDDRIYIGSSDGNFYSYDLKNGSILWSFSANGQILSSPVVTKNHVVYFGTNVGNGTIYALNSSDGSPLWSYSTTNYIMSSPAVTNGTLIIGVDDGNVYAFGVGNYTPKRPPQHEHYNLSEIVVHIRIEGKNETICSTNITLTNKSINITANSGNNYSINGLSILSALDKASKTCIFDYRINDTWYAYYGLFLQSISNDSDWWHYWINYNLPMVSIDKYILNNSDYILLGYSETWMPSPLRISLDKNSVLIDEEFTVHVEAINNTAWNPVKDAIVYVGNLSFKTDADGNIKISISSPGIYEVYAEKNNYIRSERKELIVTSAPESSPSPSRTYIYVDISYQCRGDIFSGSVPYYYGVTAFDVLDEASKIGGFSYEYRDYSIGRYIYSISGYEASGSYGWMYWVNYPSEPLPSIAPDRYRLMKNDYVVWFWGTFGSLPPRPCNEISTTTSSTSTTTTTTTTISTSTTTTSTVLTTSTTSSTTISTSTIASITTSLLQTTTLEGEPNITGYAVKFPVEGGIIVLFIFFLLFLYLVYTRIH